VFFHRALQCLVAFELKVEKFKPAETIASTFIVSARYPGISARVNVAQTG
jgi:hypothetical protein